MLKQVIQKEGLLGLYAGMESTFWRYIIWSKFSNLMTTFISCCFRQVYWNGGYFGCIHQVKALLPKPDVRAVLFSTPELDLDLIISAEPTRATLEQLRVWCHRWFRRYRVEYTVSHSAISTLIGVIKVIFKIITRFDVNQISQLERQF